MIFCLGWSRILHPTLLNLPPLGVIGYHPTSLPANRGRHPLIWALILGLKETSSSFFFMDKGADTGDLLSQVSVTIYPNDDAGSLYKRITDTALKQLHYFLPKLARGEFERIPQDHQIANTWRKRSVKDGCIDWRMAAESIHNLVRGLARPYSGAHFNYSDQEIKVWKTEVEPSAPLNLEPGKVLEICESSLLIKTGIGAIRLLDYYPKIEFKLGEYI